MLHLLLVEDNPADVLMVREGIRRSDVDADVMIAYDGEQALKFMDELGFKPDYVLLDLNLPKCDGFTILQRGLAKSGPPVIVLTASPREQDRRRALELGAIDYVVKPVGFDPFVKAVRDLLHRWAGAAAAAGSEA